MKLDRKGIAEILLSEEVRAGVTAAASAVRADTSPTASGQDLPVQIRERIAGGGGLSPRVAADVSIAHPAGARVEAKRGYLVGAAARAGLEVTPQ